MPTSERIAACIDAIRALDSALAGELKPIPAGWFSRQMLQDSGMTYHQAKGKIAKMKLRGLVESQLWKTETGMVPIYQVRKCE
jgi:hypothetical protein